MATVKLKRRSSGGSAGAPASLKSGELASNEADQILYLGLGDDGNGNATIIQPAGGIGAFVDKSNAQTVGGKKTFSVVPAASADATAGTDLVRKSQVDTLLTAKAPVNSPTFTGTPTAPNPNPAEDSTQIATTAWVNDLLVSAGAGDMLKSAYDGNDDGKVDAADVADAVPWSGITSKPASFTPSSHSHPTSEVTGLDAALAAKAPLASPALTGTPTAPTAATATNTTQIATTAFVQAVVSALIDSAPGALDTLNELAAALGDDPNFASTVTTSVAAKLAKDQNLSDLTNVGTARDNLGLGTIATQDSDSVSITGGSITGAVIDCGTF